MVFKFRMLSDENDNFVREYEVMYDMTLLDLHHFICANLKYGADHVSSFFLSDEQWEKGAEFTPFDMGDEGYDPLAPRAMDKVLLGQIVRKDRERLIYVFDQLHERALYLELVAAKKAEEGIKYPRVTLSEGAPPPPDASAGRAAELGGSIFDEAMGEFSDFSGDEGYDDE